MGFAQQSRSGLNPLVHYMSDVAKLSVWKDPRGEPIELRSWYDWT